MRYGLVTATVMLFLGCGGDDGGDNAKDAQMKCENLITSLCNRAVGCKVETNLTACQQTLDRTIDCAKVYNVKPEYSRCLDQTNTFQCNVLFPGGAFANPASCEHIFDSTQQKPDGGT